MNNETLLTANALKIKIDYAQKQFDNSAYSDRILFKNPRGDSDHIKISADLWATIRILVRAELQKNLDTLTAEFNAL